MNKKIQLVPVALVALLGLAACGESLADAKPIDLPPVTTMAEPEPKITEPEITETTEPEITDDDIEIMAMDIVWADTRDELCPMMRELLDGGMDQEFLFDYGVQSFEGGSGPLSVAGEAHLRQLMTEC
jgi:predicted small lipoprotein YifL